MSRQCMNNCMAFVMSEGMAPSMAQPRCGACCHHNDCSGVGSFNPKKSQILTLVKPMVKPVPVKQFVKRNFCY
jgi:hypothetical protein